MKKLWGKGKVQLQNIIDEYCFKEGVELDSHLVVYDVLGSIAHAKMLARIGIITDQEFLKLKKCLVEIIPLHENGKFNIESNDEDVHTKVENYLTDKLGDLGKKIHTGRSRNDQILTDLRLYSKKQLLSIAVSIYQLIDTFLSFAKKYQFVPMPGYTHMQKAMPSSVGMWTGSFAESLLDDLKLLKAACELSDQSPLGSGAAYGVSLPVDRELTAKLLGFKKVQNNSLCCQASRPKIQLAIMQSLVQVMLTLSRFASDLLLFTTSEFNFFAVPDELCTGSSIMPQKKNLDIVEFLRVKTHVAIGYEQIVASISSGLPSGYNADMGETKGPLIKSFEIVLESLKITRLLLSNMKPNIDVLKKAITKELFATHAAYELVKIGMPFRDAYQKIGKSLDKLSTYDSVKVIKTSTHIGGTGNLNLTVSFKKMLSIKKEWIYRQNQCLNVIKKLVE